MPVRWEINCWSSHQNTTVPQNLFLKIYNKILQFCSTFQPIRCHVQSVLLMPNCFFYSYTSALVQWGLRALVWICYTPFQHQTGLMEATVPRKCGGTVHLALLLMNSYRRLLLARCSCISTCCTFKWPVCSNLICSLPRPRNSRVVLRSPCTFSPNSLQPFLHLHVCSHLLLFVEKPCIPLLPRLRQNRQDLGAMEKPGHEACTADGDCQGLLPKPRIPSRWWSSAWIGFWHSVPTSPTTSSL